MLLIKKFGWKSNIKMLFMDFVENSPIESPQIYFEKTLIPQHKPLDSHQNMNIIPVTT